MQRRKLGRTGLEVSVLGYGAGAVGGLFTKGRADDQERAVARAIDVGINYFDTAALYGNGEFEKNLGRVLKALKADVVVGTKVRLSAEHRANVGKAIEQGMNDSLSRMGRDHVDLFQLHNPLVVKDAGDKLAIDIALNEVAPALEKLRKAGKTRFIGFSGVGETSALHRAIDFEALRHHPGRLQRAQPQRRRPAAQGRTRPGLRAAVRQGARPPTWARSSSARWPAARFAAPPTRHPLAMQAVDPIGSAPDFAGDVARARALEPLVRESGSADLTELAERFVIAHPAVSTMLVGYSTLDHLEAAIAAVTKGPLPAAVIAPHRLMSAIDDAVLMSIVTRVELEGGVYREPAHTQIRRARLDAILAAIPTVAFDDSSADAYAAIVADAGYSRRKLLDRMIAAQALVHRSTLVTFNVGGYADVPGPFAADMVTA